MGEDVFVVASGYHSPAPFHKDDKRAPIGRWHQGERADDSASASKTAGRNSGVNPKLLITRDFLTLSGFTLPPNALQPVPESGLRARGWPVSRGASHFMPGDHWPAGFRAYMMLIRP